MLDQRNAHLLTETCHDVNNTGWKTCFLKQPNEL